MVCFLYANFGRCNIGDSSLISGSSAIHHYTFRGSEGFNSLYITLLDNYKKWHKYEKYEIIDSGAEAEFDISDDEDIGKVEFVYGTISEEIRYRDRVVIRTTYISIAIYGVIGGLLLNAPFIWKPLLCSVAIFITIGFGTFTIANLKIRKCLEDRILRLEQEVAEQGLFNTYHAILSNKNENYRFYINMTDRIEEVVKFSKYFWISTYILLTFNAIWGIYTPAI